MSYESTANDLSTNAARKPESTAPAPQKQAPVDRTVLDEFQAQLRNLEQMQARVTFMLGELQSLIRK